MKEHSFCFLFFCSLPDIDLLPRMNGARTTVNFHLTQQRLRDEPIVLLINVYLAKHRTKRLAYADLCVSNEDRFCCCNNRTLGGGAK